MQTSMIPIEQLKGQNRQYLDRYRRGSLEYIALKDDIRANGMRVPIMVKDKGTHFLIRDGLHRHSILKELGTKEAFCCITNYDDIKAGKQ